MPVTALVTGASSGIGEATTRRLAREPGAQLILVARREERLRAVAASLPAPATWVAADLTEALLPLLRASAPSAIVNVASTAARVTRVGAGAYSASKFALAGWTDALHLEERPHGVHVGLVLPGYVATEGFPAAELLERPLARRLVSDADTAAEAIADVALHRRAERYVPRPWALLAVARVLAPGLLRRLQGTRAGAVMARQPDAD